MVTHGVDDLTGTTRLQDSVPSSTTHSVVLQHRATRRLHLHLKEMLLHGPAHHADVRLVTGLLAPHSSEEEQHDATPALNLRILHVCRHGLLDERTTEHAVHGTTHAFVHCQPVQCLQAITLQLSIPKVFPHCCLHQFSAAHIIDVRPVAHVHRQFSQCGNARLLHLQIMGIQAHGLEHTINLDSKNLVFADIEVLQHGASHPLQGHI
mmetsp:Transcript_35524/g.94539  ORF Transcript_35524/g.94539 Transcript_35524/m.94539 type:complete len:208 (+) Transcript_35524:511-1134(+)